MAAVSRAISPLAGKPRAESDPRGFSVNRPGREHRRLSAVPARRHPVCAPRTPRADSLKRSTAATEKNPARGTGILNNELYVGRIVWNRLRYVKDPDTGKRVSRPNFPAEWITTDVPHLRIIDDELWKQVKARQAEMRLVSGNGAPTKVNRARRPKFLFSGLAKCSQCGGGYVVYWRDRLACFAARSRGTAPIV
jgi:hypothetical protein